MLCIKVQTVLKTVTTPSPPSRPEWLKQFVQLSLNERISLCFSIWIPLSYHPIRTVPRGRFGAP